MVEPLQLGLALAREGGVGAAADRVQAELTSLEGVLAAYGVAASAFRGSPAGGREGLLSVVGLANDDNPGSTYDVQPSPAADSRSRPPARGESIVNDTQKPRSTITSDQDDSRDKKVVLPARSRLSSPAVGTAPLETAETSGRAMSDIAPKSPIRSESGGKSQDRPNNSRQSVTAWSPVQHMALVHSYSPQKQAVDRSFKSDQPPVYRAFSASDMGVQARSGNSNSPSIGRIDENRRDLVGKRLQSAAFTAAQESPLLLSAAALAPIEPKAIGQGRMPPPASSGKPVTGETMAEYRLLSELQAAPVAQRTEYDAIVDGSTGQQAFRSTIRYDVADHSHSEAAQQGEWQSAGAAALSSPDAPSSNTTGFGEGVGEQSDTTVGGDVFLDGALLGRWISRMLNREAGRASAGPTGYDIRRGRLLPGPNAGV